jgi:hypothetical protein
MSRFLKVLLWWSGGISAVAFAFPDLIIIGLYLFVIPGLILSLAPAVFFYTALFSLFWFKGPFAGTWRAGSLGSLALAVVAIGVPTVLNLLTTGALKVANARDKNPAKPFNPVATIAIQPADRYWSQNLCGDLCQLLLYNGAAQRVISLPPPPEPDEKNRNARSATAFRIVKNANCADAKELIRNDRGGNWLQESRKSPATTQSIGSAVRLRIAGGECLVSEPITDRRADLLIRRVDEVIGIKDQRFGLLPGPVNIRALELVVGDKVVARGSENKASKLIIPLFPAPRMRGMSVSDWEWARISRYSEGYDVLAQLSRFTTFRLTTPDGADGKTLRATIDAALANLALPADHAAFGLLDDYYDLVREKGPIDGDAARLAKLISDERNIKFWFFPAWKLNDAEKLTLRDPILNRLPQLIAADKPDSYKALQQLVDSLPEGALSAPDSRVDALIADPASRRRTPTLVKRLADRGPVAIDQLVTIMREGWTAPREIDGDRIYNYGDDAEAALSGLCRLGPAAKSALPKLRAMAAAGIVPPRKQESDEWRSLLVALGADANEFELPKDRTWKTDLYRDRLRRDAAKCGTGE